MVCESIGDKFIIILLLQIDQGELNYTKNKIIKILKNEKIISDFSIFPTLGKHDLICLLYSDKLPDAIDIAYMMVHSIPGIRDFCKLSGFNWCTISNDIDDSKPPELCFTLIKINLIKSNLNALNTIENTVQEIKTIIDNQNENISVEINGCFGWHDLSCLIKCKSYKTASDLIEKLRSKTELPIWSTSTIPLATKYLTKDEKLAMLVYSKPGHDDYTIKWLEKNFSVLAKFGIYDFIACPKFQDKISFEKILKFKEKCASIRDTATFLMTDTVNYDDSLPNIFISKKGSKLLPNISPESEFKNRKREYKEERDKGDIINLKLLSIQTIYRMLKRCPIYDYLVPLNLEKMIRWIRKNVKDTEVKNEFLKHLRYMFQQRFSGSQVEGLLGIEGGLLEQMGGYQKMVLASESIPFKAAIDNSDILNNSFIVFEHAPQFETPYYFNNNINLNREEGVPGILHLPMVKYNPYYWIFSLHEFAEQYPDIFFKNILKDKEIYSQLGFQAYQKVQRMVNNSANETKENKKYANKAIDKRIDRWNAKIKNREKLGDYQTAMGNQILPDYFACRFIDKEIYQRISLEYIENNYKDNKKTDKKFDMMLRLALIENKEENKKKSRETTISNYSSLLEKGKLVSDLSDINNFFSFVEAYLNLNLNLRDSPKCLSSFVMSLYNCRLEIQKDLIKKNKKKKKR